MSPGPLYRWAARDERLQEALQVAEQSRVLELKAKLDDVIENPAEYDSALVRPSWMNALMFRTKAVAPRYRDSAPVQVANVVNVGDLGPLLQALDERRQQEQRIIESERS